MPDEKTYTEEFEVNGDELLARIKELAHEGNIRRVIIRNESGRTIIDIPLAFGVVGALLAPQLAAVGRSCCTPEPWIYFGGEGKRKINGT